VETSPGETGIALKAGRFTSQRRNRRSAPSSTDLLRDPPAHPDERQEPAQPVTLMDRGEGRLSTHCGRFPHGTGWTAVDPQQPFASVDRNAGPSP